MNQLVHPTKTFVTIEGRALKAALAPIMFVVEKRNTYPILGSVKVTMAGSQLTLSGTDLDIAVEASLDVIDAAGDWAMVIDAQALAGIARVAGVMPVRIEKQERLTDQTKGKGKATEPETEVIARITLGDGDAEYELQAMDSERFPELGGDRGELIERFTNGMLGALLSKVSPFISTEETRYYLNGVAWQEGHGGRRMVATDGHRLGMCKYMPGGGTPWSRIIPAKTAALLVNYAKGRDVSVYDGGPTKIDFTFDHFTIRSKLIEGTYPDVDRVIPAPDADRKVIEFPVSEIVAAVDRAGIVSSRFHSRAVRFYGSEGRVTLECKSGEMGKAAVHTQAAWPGAEMAEFALNASYLRDMASRCEGKVSLLVKDAGSPVVMGDSDETMTRILMPMRY